MNVVRHHTGDNKTVTSLAPMKSTVQNNLSGRRRQPAAASNREVNRVNGPRLFEVREVPLGVPGTFRNSPGSTRRWRVRRGGPPRRWGRLERIGVRTFEALLRHRSG